MISEEIVILNLDIRDNLQARQSYLPLYIIFIIVKVYSNLMLLKR